MKRFLIILFALCTILFCSCLTPGVDGYNLSSAENLTEFMNQTFGKSFSLIDSEISEKHSYKKLTVYLETEEFPGKTIRAIQLLHRSKPLSARLEAVDPVCISFYTDYYFYKYEEEFNAAFSKCVSTLTEADGVSGWKLVSLPICLNFFYTIPSFTEPTDSESYVDLDNEIQKICTTPSIQDFESFFKSYAIDLNSSEKAAILLINQKFSEDLLDFCNSDIIQYYFSEKISASEVTDEELKDESFRTRPGVISITYSNNNGFVKWTSYGGTE